MSSYSLVYLTREWKVWFFNAWSIGSKDAPTWNKSKPPEIILIRHIDKVAASRIVGAFLSATGGKRVVEKEKKVDGYQPRSSVQP